jgi:hypothetical protein
MDLPHPSPARRISPVPAWLASPILAWLPPRLWAGMLPVFFGAFVRAAGPPVVSSPATLNDPAAGLVLAAELCQSKPAAAEFRGVLKTRQRDSRLARCALLSRILPSEHGWLTLYQATGSNWTEKLVVAYAPPAPTVYRHSQWEGTNAAVEPLPLTTNLWQPFASSDFLLADLGLEFLRWPRQVLVRNEMRKNRACHVLESRPAAVEPYSRVLSWVDVETGGLVLAEAYNQAGRRLKEFEVKRFKKSGDAWQVQEIEMRHLSNGSRTVLEFDVPEG